MTRPDLAAALTRSPRPSGRPLVRLRGSSRPAVVDATSACGAALEAAVELTIETAFDQG